MFFFKLGIANSRRHFSSSNESIFSSSREKKYSFSFNRGSFFIILLLVSKNFSYLSTILAKKHQRLLLNLPFWKYIPAILNIQKKVKTIEYR